MRRDPEASVVMPWCPAAVRVKGTELLSSLVAMLWLPEMITGTVLERSGTARLRCST